jgi:hypothetical protein
MPRSWAILKRLDYIVVRAGLKRLHFVGKAVAVAEGQQRKPGIEIANLATGCDVREARLGQSQEDGLILESSETCECGGCGGSDLQIEDKRLESALQQNLYGGFFRDDKDPVRTAVHLVLSAAGMLERRASTISVEIPDEPACP